MTLFHKIGAFNESNESFTCYRCKEFLNKLEELAEELDGQKYFSGKDPTWHDKNKFHEVEAIKSAFSVTEEDDENIMALKDWFERMEELLKSRKCNCNTCSKEIQGFTYSRFYGLIKGYPEVPNKMCKGCSDKRKEENMKRRQEEKEERQRQEAIERENRRKEEEERQRLKNLKKVEERKKRQ